MLSEAEAGKAMRNYASRGGFVRMAQPSRCLEEGSCLCLEPCWLKHPPLSSAGGGGTGAGCGVLTGAVLGLRRLLLLPLGEDFMPARSVAGLGWSGLGFLL